MNIAPVRLAAAAPAPSPNPEVRAVARQLLSDARDAVQRAIVATSASDHMHPELPFWSHRAVENIGAAAALVQAVASMQALTRVPVPAVVYTDGLDAARRLIVDAASAVQAGRPADLAAFAAANARLQGLLGQFDFDIHKHDPIPPAS